MQARSVNSGKVAVERDLWRIWLNTKNLPDTTDLLKELNKSVELSEEQKKKIIEEYLELYGPRKDEKLSLWARFRGFFRRR